jgi:hypothetical protein
MLPARATEADKREGGSIQPLFQRHLLDGGGHVGDGDAQIALGHLLGAVRLARCGRDRIGKGGEAGQDSFSVQW